MAESGVGARPSHEEIRRLDARLRAGWPALEFETIDGWEAAVSGRYTRRANCVSPIEAGVLETGERLDRVESFYASRGLPPVFMMHAAVAPQELDAVLEARGYARASETVVMTRPVDSRQESESSPEGRSRESKSEDSGGTVCVDERLEDAWFAASVESSRVRGAERADYRALIEQLVRKADAALFGGYETAAGLSSVALGCVREGVVSFVQVATAPEVRNRGHARRVLDALLVGAANRGVSEALLSVEADNGPARRLYERLGFEERYRYWYRARPE